GNAQAKILQDALRHLDQYISATKLGITIVSLALGWLGEPTLAHFIEPLLPFLPTEAAIVTAHTLAVVLAFIIITFLHIVLGELAPKSLALARPEKVSLQIIVPLILFANIFRPFIWLLNHSGQLVIKLFGLEGKDESGGVHSEEEVRMILRQSSAKGVIPAKEVEMVYNVFQLGDIPVKHVMVPKNKILAFKESTLLTDVVDLIENDVHSRFPVYKNSLDSIIGFVHAKDIYRVLLDQQEDSKLSNLPIVRNILKVSQDKKIGAVLQEMRDKRIHLAVVRNKDKKTVGIVTLEDIIESVVGEIEDEFDKPTAH
ncbi:HlyC/CorC family transporter, partial [Candidatus Microgenomates bacterium]|nr:HlyC/CorC family transporter [Candidatus Microgenomates bacterium]